MDPAVIQTLMKKFGLSAETAMKYAQYFGLPRLGEGGTAIPMQVGVFQHGDVAFPTRTPANRSDVRYLDDRERYLRSVAPGVKYSEKQKQLIYDQYLAQQRPMQAVDADAVSGVSQPSPGAAINSALATAKQQYDQGYGKYAADMQKVTPDPITDEQTRKLYNYYLDSQNSKNQKPKS